MPYDGIFLHFGCSHRLLTIFSILSSACFLHLVGCPPRMPYDERVVHFGCSHRLCLTSSILFSACVLHFVGCPSL
ncbi:hypothetical protein MT325_m428L [Paramecium bursaria chlorella virus MT325]|uniref:Uncharacterized protein m428L n=1 Tax=Paramecium bursaria Chlorella virus MT325 TaxID=346932 RepID=A7IUF8_PBCVM|nr:hypothetical protein MT325_m428L [Paramecium bursaria chlorella virus MT325]